MKKLLLFFLFISNFSVFSQNENNGLKKGEDTADNYLEVYSMRSNVLTITVQNSTEIDVVLSIASEDCIMPDFIGKLSLKGLNEFTGTVQQDYGHLDLEENSYNLTIEIIENFAIVSSIYKLEEWELGAHCWVVGKYKK